MLRSFFFKTSEQSSVVSPTKENELQLVVGKVATISDIPAHLHSLVAATSFMSAVTHKIDTQSARPVCQPVRRTPFGFQGEEEVLYISRLCLKQASLDRQQPSGPPRLSRYAKKMGE